MAAGALGLCDATAACAGSCGDGDCGDGMRQEDENESCCEECEV